MPISDPSEMEKAEQPHASAAVKKHTWPSKSHFLLLLILLCAYIFGEHIGWFTDDPRNLVWNYYTQSHGKHARRILKKNPLVDGHNDLAISIRGRFGNQIYSKNFTKPFEQGGLSGNVDLLRMDQGEYGGAFMSAFWLCPADPYDFSDAAYAPIVQATFQQLDLLHRLSNEYPKYFPHTPTAAVARRNFKHGKHIAPLAIEGLHQIGKSFANLRTMYDLGVRYATLNWNCHNNYTDAAVLTYLLNGTSIPAPPLHGGVSLPGRLLIHEMNRLGMIVDLAHVSVNTMRDVLIGEHNPSYPLPLPPRDGLTDTSASEEGKEDMADTAHTWHGSLAPPIISHSSAHALCPHPRNVPDAILHLVAKRNSVVMVNFNPEFISCHYDPAQNQTTELPTSDLEGATLDRVADHIVHIGELVGYAHVGIGSDFDGIESAPKGLEGVDKMPSLVAELLRRGVSERDVVKVVGGNVLRIWEEVERVSRRMQRDGIRPAEDALGKLL